MRLQRRGHRWASVKDTHKTLYFVLRYSAGVLNKTILPSRTCRCLACLLRFTLNVEQITIYMEQDGYSVLNTVYAKHTLSSLPVFNSVLTLTPLCVLTPSYQCFYPPNGTWPRQKPTSTSSRRQCLLLRHSISSSVFRSCWRHLDLFFPDLFRHNVFFLSNDTTGPPQPSTIASATISGALNISLITLSCWSSICPVFFGPNLLLRILFWRATLHS